MHRLRSIVTVFLALAVGVSSQACSSSPSDDHEDVAQSSEPLTVICPQLLGCCVTTSITPLAWDMTSHLESQLSAWGCSKPRLYQPSQQPNAWWYWSQCSDPGQRVESFLASHPEVRAAPYLAVTSRSLDILCVPIPLPGTIDVLWDPTCSTCKLIK